VYGQELSLEQAISMVQANEPQYGAAVAERGVLALEQTNAKTCSLRNSQFTRSLMASPQGASARFRRALIGSCREQRH
jgi:hypothetical protein